MLKEDEVIFWVEEQVNKWINKPVSHNNFHK